MEDMNMNQLVAYLRRMASKYDLWSPGDCIVVAVSGGPDSVALLHALHHIAKDSKAKLNLVCAHVNHGFRGKESDSEAEFVRGIAKDLGIPFELGSYDVPAYMEESGLSVQTAAREKRYEFLHRTAQHYNASSIALAHHGDDQAETVMLRLLRGTGMSGLAGMRVKRREKNVELIRPLLRIYKTDLIQVCRNSGLEYVTDSSNLSNKYARNAVRLDVLPFLGQYNGQLAESLNRLAEVAGEEDDYMQQAVKEAYAAMVSQVQGGSCFPVKEFARLHVALQRRLIKLILNYLPLNTDDMDFVKIEAIREGVLQEHPTNWTLDLGGGLRCIREYNTVSILPETTDQVKQEYTYRLEEVPARLPLPEAGRELRITIRPVNLQSAQPDWKTAGSEEALFDADKINYPLIVRSRKPGDIMKVMGLNGSKKVKDIFIDQKIPPSVRSKIPIVTDASGRILWLPGVRRSAHAAVGSSTSSILHMQMEPLEGGS
ncbi:tRNA lysidine(34) synthetase TilS [Paenibacillus sp. J22TS3]|uniref:tRNA lysidine(34) synthetase TilS n=1 Tax=Paenibacillus sp. J22TS3 TaxID=2807192 RepID=UPI001B0A0719|nr:tRNA lysidine(34) synthetase TilS [Paenibacillus sp. J22TS3]GIP24819.1 tRNA(Ile)-lysidine synthase [Paenibacillus sp. J22TS3]